MFVGKYIKREDRRRKGGKMKRCMEGKTDLMDKVQRFIVRTG